MLPLLPVGTLPLNPMSPAETAAHVFPDSSLLLGASHTENLIPGNVQQAVTKSQPVLPRHSSVFSPQAKTATSLYVADSGFS